MVRHGVDMFGRDALVLGRVLTTLGTFTECAARSPAALPLVAAVLELLAAPQVRGGGGGGGGGGRTACARERVRAGADAGVHTGMCVCARVRA